MGMVLYEMAMSPNAKRARLGLAETAAPFERREVNLLAGEQKTAGYKAIHPLGRVPTLDDDGVIIWESGAILLYLARKSRKLLPVELRGEVEATQWLFWQMAGLGPMAGQNHHFARYAPEKIPYAIERYVRETNRLYGVLNHRLRDRAYVAGEYSIADIACYPWIVSHEAQGQRLEEFPHLRRWFESIRERPATVRAYEKAAAVNTQNTITEDAKRILFGQTARPEQTAR